jgi:hypothetical protein
MQFLIEGLPWSGDKETPFRWAGLIQGLIQFLHRDNLGVACESSQ